MVILLNSFLSQNANVVLRYCENFLPTGTQPIPITSSHQFLFQIVHCLVLVLYDKVKYLLDLETNCVVEDER
jgi:hypothetical protein